MRSSLLLMAGLLLAWDSHAETELADLPSLGIEATDLSVIGVSSGGYMATQLAVAWPERFSGLAVLAAGPWSCAQGGLGQALGQCMSTRRGPPDLKALGARLDDYQARGLVGDAETLGELRAFVWHGEADEVVAPALSSALITQLTTWLHHPETQLRALSSPEIGHGWPVELHEGIPPDQMGQCRNGGGTHLLACDLDIAGEALSWLHGTLEPPGEAAPAATLLRFDQSSFDTKGLGETGYVYVPAECETGGCQLTVALHGCAMAEEQIGEAFVRYSGLNEWAAANRRVVLYPQATTSLANPQGCWDWWGFTESTWQLDPLHDTREGTQVHALMRMVDRLQESPET